MVENGNLCRALKLVHEVLEEYREENRPLNIAELCRRMGIQPKMYQPKNANPGQSYLLDGQPVILVSEKEPIDRQRQICAHELGHVLLGHVGAWGEVPDRSDLPREEREREAEGFAEECLLLL